MSKEKLIQLVEALASVGYRLSQFKDSYEDESKLYGNTEIFIFLAPDVEKYPISDTENNLSKERMIKLIEALYSAGYGIVKYERFYEHRSGELNLILQTL